MRIKGDDRKKANTRKENDLIKATLQNKEDTTECEKSVEWRNEEVAVEREIRRSLSAQEQLI